MDYLTPVADTSLLACKSYKFCILPQGIHEHFRRKPHSLSTSERTSLLELVENDASLLRDKASIQNLDIPSSIPFFYSELTLFLDGFQCHECNFITRGLRQIRLHYSESHDRVNPNPKGRPGKTSIKSISWKSEIPCQQFFPRYMGDKYFRVNPKKPWQAGARSDEVSPPILDPILESSRQETRDSSIFTQGIPMP